MLTNNQRIELYKELIKNSNVPRVPIKYYLMKLNPNLVNGHIVSKELEDQVDEEMKFIYNK